MSSSTHSDSNALPQRVSRLFEEMLWLFQLALLSLLTLALLTHHVDDPSWTLVTSKTVTNNLGGKVGAYLADLLFFLFGFSAYWILIALFRHVLIKYKQLNNREPIDFHSNKQLNTQTSSFQDKNKTNNIKTSRLYLSLGSFAVFITASTALETLRFWSYSPHQLSAAGGVIGSVIGDNVQTLLGFTGGTLFLLFMLAMSLSLWWRFSWLTVLEKIGAILIAAAHYCSQFLTVYHDRRLGESASDKREFKVAQSRLKKQSQSEWQSHSSLQDDETEVNEQTTISNLNNRVEPVLSQDNFAKRNENIHAEPKSAAQMNDINSISWAQNKNRKNANELIANETVVQTYKTKAAPPIFTDRSDKKLPSLSLLDSPPALQETIANETLNFTKRLIEKKLKDFGVSVLVMGAYPGPVVTRYEIEPATGVKGSQIVNLAKDLARSLSLISIRVVETIPGKNFMALELPNSRRQTVKLAEILGTETYRRASSPLTLGLGKDIAGAAVYADLAKMPHLLVAGTTGSGKSVGINAMILSLLYKARADQVRMILIDPKMLELSIYEGIPHLLCPVVIDMKQAGHALNWTVSEMERRYKLMSKLGVRNLAGYNTKIDEAQARGEPLKNPFSLTPDEPEPLEKLPAIVVVIDELADLMMVVGKKVEELIARIAQKARAAGIHLILATQRPSVDVITGLIKANVPTRIAFQVSSKIDSRTILDQQGADTLLGMGDMLYLPPGSGLPVRVHGAFVSDEEVHRVVEKLKEEGAPNYIEGILEGGTGSDDDIFTSDNTSNHRDEANDPLYDQAVEIVLKHRRASISLVQRHLRIGYNRAARLLEQMENAQLVSSMASNGNRDILVPENYSHRAND